MSVVIPHHQGLDRSPRYDEAVLEDRTFGIWRPACQTTLTFILSYPEEGQDDIRPRGEHEAVATLRQAVAVGPPRRMTASEWALAGVAVLAVAAIVWGLL